jgi:FixJ family two-component response regulator
MPELTLHLPVLRTYGAVVAIDDDHGFLQTLGELLACDDYSVSTFSDPAALHAFMEARRARSVEDRAKLAGIWRAQMEPQGTVALDALRYFAAPNRFEMPLALVSDYAMPRETGLSVCARYGSSGVRRILLTGVADTNVAVSAFNSGSIEQYVQKQGSTFPSSIIDTLRRQLAVAAAARGAGLAEQLNSSLTAVLADPAAASALQGLLTRLKVREYMMLGEPQGILGITREGTALWIQLETESSLDDLEDILNVAEVETAALERVRRREALVAVEWMQQIGQAQQEQPAMVVSRAPLLLAAVYPLQLPTDLRPATPAETF